MEQHPKLKQQNRIDDIDYFVWRSGDEHRGINKKTICLILTNNLLLNFNFNMIKPRVTPLEAITRLALNEGQK